MTLVLGITCLVILSRLLTRPGGFIAFPTAFVVLYLSWVLPQVAGLVNAPGVPQGGWFSMMIMALLCLLAVWIGWSLTFTGRSKLPHIGENYHNDKLILAATVLTVASVAINAILDFMRPAMAGIQQWSGPIVIVAFVAQIRNIALALTLLLAFQYRTKAALFLAAVNLATTLPVALVHLRRTDMIAISLTVAGAYWFAKRKSPKIVFVLPVAMAIGVSVYSIGELRSASNEIEMATGEKVSLLSSALWSNIDVDKTVKSNAAQASDFTNALYIIAYRQNTLDFDYGATLWNGFVFQYVSSNIFGNDMKQSLMLGEHSGVLSQIGTIFNFEYKIGTTQTGFGSAFSDFWYFGALYFFIISALLRNFYLKAKSGDIWSQVMYLSMLPMALTALTHGITTFFVPLPFIYGIIMLNRSISRHIGKNAPRHRRLNHH